MREGLGSSTSLETAGGGRRGRNPLTGQSGGSEEGDKELGDQGETRRWENMNNKYR